MGTDVTLHPLRETIRKGLSHPPIQPSNPLRENRDKCPADIGDQNIPGIIHAVKWNERTGRPEPAFFFKNEPTPQPVKRIV